MVFEMTGIAKRNALLLLGLVMMITVILAAGLSQLELQPGMPMPRLENNQVVVAPVEAEPMMTVSISNFFKTLFVLIVAGLALYTFYKLLRGADWKSIPGMIWPALVISMIVCGLILLVMLLPETRSSLPVEMPLPVSTARPTSPLGQVPPLLLWLVGFGLLAAGILIVVWISRSQTSQATTLDLVGLEAEKAWQALISGLDLKDVIIRCYRQMSLALEQERGLERKESMTTREFEYLLESAGVPHEPIHQLTRLFEAVRYGGWQPNPADERSAIECLEAIMLSTRPAQEMD
jgi:hypothetical protein